MESETLIDATAVPTLVQELVGLGYKFLPSEARKSRPNERIAWLTDPDEILRQVRVRSPTASFFLVRQGWLYREFTTADVINKHQGEMTFVDQRTWGPYIDLVIRLRDHHSKVWLHLYPRFWSWVDKRDLVTPTEVKAGYKEALRTLKKFDRARTLRDKTRE